MKLPSEYLAEGWCQGVLWDDNGKVCLLGAGLSSLGSHTGRFYEFTDACCEILGKIVGLADWNNDVSRTQAEVVDLARRAEFLMGLAPAETEDDEWIIPDEPLQEEQSKRVLQEVS